MKSTMQPGIVLAKKISDKIEKNEVLGFIHANDEEKAKQAVEDLQKAYTIVGHEVDKPEIILEVIE